VVVNFLTAYPEDDLGKMVVAPGKIALQYLKAWFVLDIVASIPMDYIVLASKVRLSELSSLDPAQSPRHMACC
jgi:hypothetical protein